MMGRFLQNLFRIFLVLLLATIGAGSSGAAPSNWSQTEFSILQPSILTGNTDPTNAAPTDLTRALALSGNLLNLAATGTDSAVPPSSEGHNYQGPIANGHWVDASNLKPGYRLLNNDETWAGVVSVKIEKKALKAYNLTVADFHTYFVRGADNDNAQPIWVHNNCWDSLPDGSKRTSRTTPDGRTVYEGPNGEEIYKGNDNRFYDAKVHAPNTTVKPGEYLNDFKPSPTPLELVQNAGSQGSRTATIRYDHIMDGIINGAGKGSGGHYVRSDNIRVTEYAKPAYAYGVRTGYIQVRDPNNGGWVPKRAETSFYPENWSRRQTTVEIEGAFQNSSPVTLPTGNTGWQGTSPSGVPIRGFYISPDGGAATAWPVHGG